MLALARPVIQHLELALQGALKRPYAEPLVPSKRQSQTLLLLGAGGSLGSAMLAEALMAGRFARVQALVAEPLASALRGFEPLPMARLNAGLDDAPLADAAVIVFERERHSNGRDAAFVQPEPAALLSLAQRLHACGVRRLAVVVPHAPALLPQALRHGLATLDEGAVAALGFEHLVFVRAAQYASPQGGSRLQRFADWWLSQLRWMVPPTEQPVRAATLARLVVELLRTLPSLPPATRVLAPESLWQLAQGGSFDVNGALAAWAGGRKADRPP